MENGEKFWLGDMSFSRNIFTRDLPNMKRDSVRFRETFGPASYKFISVSSVAIKHLQLKEHREITSEPIY